MRFPEECIHLYMLHSVKVPQWVFNSKYISLHKMFQIHSQTLFRESILCTRFQEQYTDITASSQQRSIKCFFENLTSVLQCKGFVEANKEQEAGQNKLYKSPKAEGKCSNRSRNSRVANQKIKETEGRYQQQRRGRQTPSTRRATNSEFRINDLQCVHHRINSSQILLCK